jgi:P27 family predicted phage terminase small subunit
MPRFGKKPKTDAKTGAKRPRKSNAGRKPKPTALHVINGNPSKINLEARQKAEPQFSKVAPDCPEFLDQYAREEWQRMAPELERLGLLTYADLAAFAAYCANYSIWRQADEMVRKDGMVVKVVALDRDGEIKYESIRKHPAVSIRSDAFEKMKAFLIEFGFTPASRSRVNAVDPDQKQDGKKKVGGLLSR